jgi:hypothetical protein
MSLTAGDKIGPYEILSGLGAGGMGEVYRAHDTRLRRDVAIKVSAERFSERFATEARAIASLNHRNICHLYDVGSNYLVMELVDSRLPAPDGTRLAVVMPVDTPEARKPEHEVTFVFNFFDEPRAAGEVTLVMAVNLLVVLVASCGGRNG